MFCFYCGNNLPDNVVFCNRCGNRQNVSGNQVIPSFPIPPANLGQYPPRNVPVVQGTPQAGSVPTAQGIRPVQRGYTPGQGMNPAAISPGSAPSMPLQPRYPAPQAPPQPLWPPASATYHPNTMLQQTVTQPPSEHHLHHNGHHQHTNGQKLAGHVSRRAVMLGLAGATTALVAGGGLTLALRSGALNPSISPSGGGNSSSSSTPVPVNSPMFGFDPQHTYYNPYEHVLNPQNVSRLSLYWEISMGAVLSSPAVVNGVVYIGSADHKLYALNAGTGAVLWSYTTGDYIISSPAVVNGVVYIGSADHSLYALDARTGARLWTYMTGDIIISSPTVVNEVLYFGSFDHVLYALDARTGAKLWTYTTGASILPSPAVANGVIFLSQWLAYSGQNDLYALDARTGALLWKGTGYGGDSYSSAAVSNGVVYTNSIDTTYALDAKTGSVVWKVTQPGENNNAASPAIANGVVYTSPSSGHLQAMDAKTGAILWTNEGSTPLSLTVANGVVYMGSRHYYHMGSQGGSKKMYAFNAKTGAILWSYEAEEGVLFAPVVVNGIVYVGSGDFPDQTASNWVPTGPGKMYAFHLPGGAT